MEVGRGGMVVGQKVLCKGIPPCGESAGRNRLRNRNVSDLPKYAEKSRIAEFGQRRLENPIQ